MLYPAVPVPSDAQLADASKSWKDELPVDLAAFIKGASGAAVFLSINRYQRGSFYLQHVPLLGFVISIIVSIRYRFERKKGIGLAVTALAELQAQGKAGPEARLIIAGGYDVRLAENRWD